MESSLGPLFPLLERERAAGRALALAVLVHTAGSTYRKPGALLLIAQSGEYAGLLSGGCLESDLAERAREVIETGRARFITYDLRDERDLVWGLGLGCEGVMRILLLRAGPEEQWEPLAHLASALAAHSPAAVGIVTDSADAELPIGALVLPGAPRPQPLPRSLSWRAKARLTVPIVATALESARDTASVGWVEESAPDWRLFVLPLSLPPRLLLLGAGPDALPVADLAARQHWKVTLVDHRPAYADPSHFPAAEHVVLSRPEALAHAVDLGGFSAAVVMSHHLPSDLEYLRALAASPAPGYVGLLGPPARRDKLLGELGRQGETLSGRLRAPVGFDLGGRTPESIALAIVAEIHAFLCGAPQRERTGHP
jgi:xanthine/CO dehydrogenase XdhC/CoxF family maturation factor